MTAGVTLRRKANRNHQDWLGSHIYPNDEHGLPPRFQALH